MSNLPANDPRHGTTNGYRNLGCRCNGCKAAGTASQYERYTKIDVGEHQISVPRDFRNDLEAYARRNNTSMRQVAMLAISAYIGADNE